MIQKINTTFMISITNQSNMITVPFFFEKVSCCCTCVGLVSVGGQTEGLLHVGRGIVHLLQLQQGRPLQEESLYVVGFQCVSLHT